MSDRNGRRRQPRTGRGDRSHGTTRSRQAPSRAKARRRPASTRRRRFGLMPIGNRSSRLRFSLIIVTLFLAVCIGRAFQLQAFDSEAFADEAAEKMQATRELPAVRGTITDRNGTVLAATEPAMLISADPDMVTTNGADKRYPMSEAKQEEADLAPEAVAEILSKHLGGPTSDYLEILTTEDSRYEIIERKVPAATWTAIQKDMKSGLDGEGERPWHGLFADEDPIRTYPQHSLASNVIGYVNSENQGAGGLEIALEDELSGEPGQEVYDRSTYGRIPLGTNVMTPPLDGDDFELTLDADLQWFVEQTLADGMREAGAKTGTAVVMDVSDGEILALANAPSFDPSDLGATDAEDWGNRAVQDAYEPGSVQKVLTMAALADQGLVTPDTKVVVPPRISSGGRYIRDAYDHGTVNLTMRGIVANSSNIGTVQLARTMPKDTLVGYLADFGLGAEPGLGLPMETAGSIPEPDMADYTRDQISFGQGLSVSAVQMATAVSAAVNGGVYHQPQIIKSGTKADGTPVELPEPESHRVISEDASAMVVDAMESVISQMGDNRPIPGYRTIGKSGTSQRFDASCQCYNGYTASFIGVAPAEDPKLAVYVVLDQPSNGNLGSELALPVVNNILQMALPRYNVLPSTSEAPSEPLTHD